jgi:hypothetical protein
VSGHHGPCSGEHRHQPSRPEHRDQPAGLSGAGPGAWLSGLLRARIIHELFLLRRTVLGLPDRRWLHRPDVDTLPLGAADCQTIESISVNTFNAILLNIKHPVSRIVYTAILLQVLEQLQRMK